MRARFFVRRPTGAPWYVFRVLPDVSIEVYDVAEHGWRSRPLEPVYRWAVIDGEIGVDEIPATTAGEIIRSIERGSPLPPPALEADVPRLRLTD